MHIMSIKSPTTFSLEHFVVATAVDLNLGPIDRVK